MISPSPTKQPPNSAEPERKKVESSSAVEKADKKRKRSLLKSIFRPILKGIYYLLQAARNHKLLSLGAVILLLLSIGVTTYFTTGTLPFGIGSDPGEIRAQDIQSGGATVQRWLRAVRTGDTGTIQQIDANISQPPDANQLVSQLGQNQSRTWTGAKVLSSTTQADTTVDSFVAVDFSSGGTGGVVIFHFITIQGSENLYGIDVIGPRRAVQ